MKLGTQQKFTTFTHESSTICNLKFFQWFTCEVVGNLEIL